MVRFSGASRSAVTILALLIILTGCRLVHNKMPVQQNTCNATSDCILATQVLNDCCYACSLVPMAKADFEMREQWMQKNCDGAECPMYDCQYNPDMKAVCKEGKCIDVFKTIEECDNENTCLFFLAYDTKNPRICSDIKEYRVTKACYDNLKDYGIINETITGPLE